MPKVSKLTIIPAIRTPIKIDQIDLLKDSPKIQAASAPVQAPVLGRGMATNIISPNTPYLFILVSVFFLVRIVNQVKKRLNNFDFLFNQAEIFGSDHKMNKGGSMLPITDTIYTCHQGSLKAASPNGIATLNSPIGVRALRKTLIISFI